MKIVKSFVDSLSYSLAELWNNNDVKSNERAYNCKTYKIKYTKLMDKYIFLIKCKEDYSDPKGHIVSISFDSMNPTEESMKPNLLNVSVWCSCPAWQYWGSAYNSTALDYNLAGEGEDRIPNIRDPHTEHIICKHVARVKLTTFSTMNTRQIEKRYKSKASTMKITSADLKKMEESLDEVEIKDTFPVIEEYLKRIKMEGMTKKFEAGLTPENYYKSLKSIKLVA